MSSGLEARLPTYPMIPHIRSLRLYPTLSSEIAPEKSPENTKARPRGPSQRRGGSLTELSSNARCDASTGLRGDLDVLGLGEHPNQGLRAGRAHQDTAPAVPGRVQPLDLVEDDLGQLPVFDPDVLLGLGPARHHGCRLAQGAALEGPAEEQAGGEAVAGHVVAQIDDVAGLLAAEDRAFALQRLEHVAVADVGRVHDDAALAHQRVEAEVRHHGDGDLLDLLVECQHGDDLVAVDRLAVLLHSA